MRQIPSLRVAFLFPLLTLCFAVTAHAQPLAGELPATTLVYSGWSPNASLQDTMAARMLADPRVVGPWRALIGDLLQSMPGEVKEGGAAVESLPKLLADASQCEGCFALLDISKGEKGQLNPQAVFILNLGAKRPEFEAHFQPIHAAIKEKLGDSMHLLKVDKSWLWSKTEHEHDEYFWGFVGDRFVVYFGDGGEAFLRAMAAGKPAAPLESAPAFVDCLSKLPGEAVATTYIDVPAMLEISRVLLNQNAMSDLTDNWQATLLQIGLDNAKSIGEKTVVQDQQFVTRQLLRTAGPPHGLLASLIGPGVEEAMYKAVPRDAMAVFSTRLDLVKTYNQIKAAAIAIGGTDAQHNFQDLEQEAKAAGVAMPDALAPLGDQWVVYTAGSTGGTLLTGWTLVGNVKDVAAFNHQADILTKLLIGPAGTAHEQGITRREYQVEGITIHYLELGGLFELFSPAWAQVGDKMVLALYPQVVEDAVHQLSEEKSILDNPEFMAARKRTGSDGPLIYLVGPELVKNFYPLLLVYAQVMHEVAGSEAPAQTALNELLPSMQRLLAYVGEDAVSAQVTPDGILRTKSIANPLLSPFTLTDNIPLLIALAIPSLHESQEASARMKSAANLRQVGMSLMLYSQDHKGAYPPDFATVRKDQDLTPALFDSPDGGGKGGVDYVYLVWPGMQQSALTNDTPVAYDAAELAAGEGANVLFGDGHIDFLDNQDAVAAIEKIKKAHPDIVEPAKQKYGGRVVAPVAATPAPAGDPPPPPP